MSAYRFSEKSFRRYEDYIRRVVEGWPAVQTFDPRPLSVETFSCRMRDAMSALRANNSWVTSVDKLKFGQIHHEIVVSISTHGLVRVGSKETLSELTPAGTALSREAALKIRNPSPREVEALAVLSAGRHLRTPIEIHGFFDSAFCRTLEAKLDCSFEDKGEGVMILL